MSRRRIVSWPPAEIPSGVGRRWVSLNTSPVKSTSFDSYTALPTPGADIYPLDPGAPESEVGNLRDHLEPVPAKPAENALHFPSSASAARRAWIKSSWAM